MKTNTQEKYEKALKVSKLDEFNYGKIILQALEEQAQELHYKYRFDFSKELQKELQAQKQKFTPKKEGEKK